MDGIDRRQLFSRVEKLLAHAWSAARIGNHHEANAYADKAWSMLFEHGLTAAELEGRERMPWDATDLNNCDLFGEKYLPDSELDARAWDEAPRPGPFEEAAWRAKRQGVPGYAET